MRTARLCILIAFAASTALGQEFEVVSVKPNQSGDNGSSSHSDRGMLTSSNVNLRSLIMMAYGVNDYQVEGPDWLKLQRFDVSAKFPEALSKDREKFAAELRTMMQKMLADRFKLAVHRESKVFPIYGLVVEKGGIKFKQVPDSNSHSQNSNNAHYTGKCVSMDSFAAFLARQRDLPVLNMSGLEGFYDMTLDWSPESRSGADGKNDGAADNPAGPPPLDLALQEQLGLKLERRKAPIEILIVDHAEKSPTEN